MLVDPLRVEDCCLISDGGAAYVMTTPERARDLRKPPVLVAGVGEGPRRGPLLEPAGRLHGDAPGLLGAGGLRDGRASSPSDVDVLTLYDPFTIVALMQIEDMGFCEKGDGGAPSSRRLGSTSTAAAALQHPRRAALPRLRARHLPRRRGVRQLRGEAREPGAAMQSSASTVATPVTMASTLVLRSERDERPLAAPGSRLGSRTRGVLARRPRAASW